MGQTQPTSLTEKVKPQLSLMEMVQAEIEKASAAQATQVNIAMPEVPLADAISLFEELKKAGFPITVKATLDVKFD